MAKIGEVPAANRYSTLSIGPDSTTVYETQEGVPVDGTRALNRDIAPFSIRLIPPDVLLSTIQAVDAIMNLTANPSNELGSLGVIDAALTNNLGAIDSAAVSSNLLAQDSTVAAALGNVTLINTDSTVLRQIIADGELFAERGDTAYSSIVNAATAADIALQLQGIINAPPLTLLVNPSSMNISFTKLQNYGSRVRSGYIFEAWGLEQPKMSISGSTAGFIAGLADRSGVSDTQFTNQVSSQSGYQWASRRDSAAWQNFMSLYTFYRNNGYIYDTIGRSEAHQFIGAVVISYDQMSYVGHFESFDFTFDEANQHRVEFSAEFTISQMFDAAVPPTAITPLNAPTTSLSDPKYTSRVTNTPANGALDLVSRNERADFGQDVADLAQSPLELFR